MKLAPHGDEFCDMAPPECEDGAQRACGSQLGECATNTQTCVVGSWSVCGGPAPAAEICDGKDNDCDGDVDEGFGLGTSCALVGGCPGHLVCSADGKGTRCDVDSSRTAPEICDGIDNDCDGFVDYTLSASELVSACQCESTTAIFANPADRSMNDPLKLCETTRCVGSAQELSMSFCLNCDSADPKPHAMCENSLPLDLSHFDGRASGAVFLEVHYEYSSTTPVLIPINLWYLQGDSTQRKYLPLLRPGDTIGTYTRVFTVSSSCLPKGNGWGESCIGSTSGAACGECSPNDTCGENLGCSTQDFSMAKIQIAAEWCPGSLTKVAGEIKVTSLRLVSLGCLYAAQP